MTLPNREATRKPFFDAWRKYNSRLLLSPLETQIVAVILLHPEYHALLTDPETYQSADFTENNPFLHLGLHLALREQINTNRPKGINTIYKNLCHQYQDEHIAEHHMLECLSKTLWEAQQSGTIIDEQQYLEQLQRIIKK
jgi:hypothetical protein